MSRVVKAEFSPDEAQAVLTCIREYFAMLLERGGFGDASLSSAASLLYAAMLDAGVTPDKLE
ncbi:MAG TPA: hypothetical protein VMJ65_07500 [Solirubrobacteraceae bacterium]|nr:hypothetical protein [Solirubrobacteraceae bacterium]